MKKIAKAVLVLICVVLMASACTGGRVKNAGYKLYRSSPVGIEIEYPDFWDVAESKTERTVAFVSPKEGFSDGYRDNVTVVSYEIGDEDMAFDSYVRSYIDKLPSDINEYNKVTENELTAAGYTAYNIVYEGNTDEGKLRLSQTFLKSGKYVYIFSFIAEPSSYDYFKMNADTMLKTVRLLHK